MRYGSHEACIAKSIIQTMTLANKKSNLELVKAALDVMKAPTNLIEGKLKRTGELRVKLVMMREDLEGARFAQTVHPGDRGHADADA